ncbi:MAG: hypothetical protein PHD67_05645 [Oscillospiraceae bacterium]|nr:hypothetical protein [Oscillospiraceae bacterium]
MRIDIKDITGKIVGEVNQEAASRAVRAANELRNSAQRVLKGQRSGKVYRKPYTKKAKYTASAPGEPPAQRSGMLRLSWKATASSQGETPTTFTVKPAITTDIKYAPWLQEGTPKIKPRPFEEPIVDGAKDKVKAIFSEPYLNK